MALPLTDPIPVHAGDLDAVTQRLLEVTDATGGAVPREPFAELPKETADQWRAWAQRACDGLSADRCGGTTEAHVASRELAAELAEARRPAGERGPIETGRVTQRKPPAQQSQARRKGG